MGHKNFFTPQRETGRMSGGVSCLLLGQGDAMFDEVLPAQSGIVLPGDAKSTIACDLNDDNHLDIIVAVNNERIRVFSREQSFGENQQPVSYFGAGYLSGGPPTPVQK